MISPADTSTRSSTFSPVRDRDLRGCWSHPDYESAQRSTSFRQPWEYQAAQQSAKVIKNQLHNTRQPKRMIHTSATQEKKTVVAFFEDFLVTELHSREGTALRVACGRCVPQGHPPTRVFNSQVHDRGWSCGHGRYIPMSVTQLLYSQGPCL